MLSIQHRCLLTAFRAVGPHNSRGFYFRQGGSLILVSEAPVEGVATCIKNSPPFGQPLRFLVHMDRQTQWFPQLNITPWSHVPVCQLP